MINLYSLKSLDFKQLNIKDIQINNHIYDYILYDPSINVSGHYIQNGDQYIRRKQDAFRYGLKDKNDLVIKNYLVLEDGLSFDLYIYRELIGHYYIKADNKDLEAIMIALSLYYLEGKEISI